jgi:hypothetical protein
LSSPLMLTFSCFSSKHFLYRPGAPHCEGMPIGDGTSYQLLPICHLLAIPSTSIHMMLRHDKLSSQNAVQQWRNATCLQACVDKWEKEDHPSHRIMISLVEETFTMKNIMSRTIVQITEPFVDCAIRGKDPLCKRNVATGGSVTRNVNLKLGRSYERQGQCGRMQSSLWLHLCVSSSRGTRRRLERMPNVRVRLSSLW